jgi:hypothetical protein
VFADKGYVSQNLAKQLLKTTGVQLITKLRRNMKNHYMEHAAQVDSESLVWRGESREKKSLNLVDNRV